MLSDQEFVRQSLELNLFFMRIAKEHSIFIQASLMPKDYDLIQQADYFKNMFSQLLVEAISLSEGIISTEVENSGELVTDLTLSAERETQFYSGIEINSNITMMEINLFRGSGYRCRIDIVRRVEELNHRAIIAANNLAKFKAALLNNVLNCQLFTMNYPLLLDHILREARFYLSMLTRLQNREEIDMVKDAVLQEEFWNRIMAEHAKFIRGLLDPTEEKLFDTANDFGKRFDELTKEAQELTANTGLLPEVTEKTLKDTTEIRDFKKQGTEGLIKCTIRSIAYPLLGDHVVREANHYIRLLKSFKTVNQI